MFVGLEVQGQISLQGLQDGGGVRQGQTLPQDARVGLAHLGEVKGNRNQGRKEEC